MMAREGEIVLLENMRGRDKALMLLLGLVGSGGSIYYSSVPERRKMAVPPSERGTHSRQSQSTTFVHLSQQLSVLSPTCYRCSPFPAVSSPSKPCIKDIEDTFSQILSRLTALENSSLPPASAETLVLPSSEVKDENYVYDLLDGMRSGSWWFMVMVRLLAGCKMSFASWCI